MVEVSDPHSASDGLICHLLVTPQREVAFQGNPEVLHIDSLDPIAIPPLRRWDKARRAQGLPPTLEQFIEAYWLGFGCLRWLAGLIQFYACAGCGKWIPEAELSAHAEECIFTMERKETGIPDPPEEIYVCPDEECGFWSTEYPDIRAPHRSRAHDGTHNSHSFILEDDPDIILDLWMRRYPGQVRETYRCRLCEETFPIGSSTLDHFVQRHVKEVTSVDILGGILNARDFSSKKDLSERICSTIRKQNIHEILIIFSPSFQRFYREKIAPMDLKTDLTPDVRFQGKWVENVLDVISAYGETYQPVRFATDISQSRASRSPASRVPSRRGPAHLQVSACATMSIRVHDLLRRLSAGKSHRL